MNKNLTHLPLFISIYAINLLLVYNNIKRLLISNSSYINKKFLRIFFQIQWKSIFNILKVVLDKKLINIKRLKMIMRKYIFLQWLNFMQYKSNALLNCWIINYVIR